MNTTHGESNSAEFRVWAAIIARCYNPKNSHWKYYGARGIGMCDLWRDDFAAFLTHVGRRPSTLHTIDRKDNDLGYAPGNVRWATRSEQNSNRRPYTRRRSVADTNGKILA